MASPHTIAAAITRLLAAGYRQPENVDLNNQESQTAFIAVWSEALSDLTDDELNTAVRAFIKSTAEPWFPVPAKLRSFVSRVGLAIRDDSDAAFAEVFALVGRFHHYKHPKIEDLDTDRNRARAKRRAIKSVGGWDRICESRPGDRGLRASFVQAYRTSVAHVSRQIEGTDEPTKMLEVG